MKKTFLILLLAVASAPAAFAQAAPGGALSSKDYTGGQTTDSRNTGFGVKAGYNLSNLRGDDIKGIDRQSRNDFHAGLYGQLGFNQFSSVQVELLYSRQGFEANTGILGARERYRLDYLALPIMYVGNVTETLSFHLGPQVMLLNNARRAEQTLALSDNGFHTFDYGGVAGVEARVGPARLGARYNLSLGKLFKEGNSASTLNKEFANSNIYNNLFQLYVGIGITQ